MEHTALQEKSCCVSTDRTGTPTLLPFMRKALQAGFRKITGFRRIYFSGNLPEMQMSPYLLSSFFTGFFLPLLLYRGTSADNDLDT